MVYFLITLLGLRCCGTIFVHYEYVLILLINSWLTGNQAGSIGGKTKLNNLGSIRVQSEESQTQNELDTQNGIEVKPQASMQHID